MTLRHGGIGELHHALAEDCKGLLPEAILGPLDAAYVNSPCPKLKTPTRSAQLGPLRARLSCVCL